MAMRNSEGSSAARSYFRKSDLIAVAGLAAVLIGMLIFRVGMKFVPAWIAWMVAPLLWYSGFALLTGWAFGRMMNLLRDSQRQRSVRKEDAELARPTLPLLVATAEFAEHDFVFEPFRETA
jgi:hypothetical protein